MIVFVQPFSLQSPGGGPRILRALMHDSPLPTLCLCTAQGTPPVAAVTEQYLPVRPHLGRIERTRFGAGLGALEALTAPLFKARLAQICRDQEAAGIHAVAHSLDFWYAYQVAQHLRLSFSLSVHDDLAYALRGKIECRWGMAHLGEAWRNARVCFVISDAMGREYARRYGERPYQIITDGLAHVPNQPRSRPARSLRLYFMGLFHLSYEANLSALLSALALLRREKPSLQISITCRCGALAPGLLNGPFPVTLLPYGTETDVAQDMEEADMLYLPLPFGPTHTSFVRYSLSTKMITYLGSGLPILYHGPAEAATGELLAAHGAATQAETLDAAQIAAVLAGSLNRPETLHTQVCQALALGREQFLLADQRARFWREFSSARPAGIGSEH